LLPTLVVAGWVLMATQPGSGWGEGRIASWSSSIGVLDVVHDLGLWHGVLAFGLGLVLGLSLDTVPVEAGHAVEAGPAVDAIAVDRGVADEPLTAERETAVDEADRTTTRVG